MTNNLEKEEIKVDEIKINRELIKKNKENRKIKITKDSFFNFLIKCVTVITLCVLTFLTIAAISHTAYFWRCTISDPRENMHYEDDNILFNIVNVTIIIALISIFKIILSKVNNKILITIASLIILILGYNWMNFVKAPVIGDQKIVLEAAESFSKGDYENINKHYFFMHPLQYGCVLGFELIIKCLGNADNINLQIINLLFLCGSVFTIYLITNKIYENKNISKLTTILISIMFVIPLFATVVYGNIFGMFFSLLSIYFLIKFYEKYEIKYICLISLSNMLAIIWKSNYEIVMIAIIISLIIDLIKKFNIKTFVCIIAIIGLFSLSYPVVYKIVELRTGEKVNSGVPMISYIAMGIQEPIDRQSGWYHPSINVESIYIEANNDEKQAKEKSIELINDRIEVFKKDLSIFKWYYKDKICSTWLEPAFQTLWWAAPGGAYHEQSEEYKTYVDSNEKLQKLLYGDENRYLIKTLDCLQILVYSMSIISLVYSIKNNTYNYKNSTLLITFLGGFLFHILWETKSIYVIPYFIMLIPSAADGIEIINEKFKDTFFKIKDFLIIKLNKETK